MTSKKKIRFAVVGASRGKTFIEAAQVLSEDIELVAVCDIRPESLKEWANHPSIKVYAVYEELLNDPDVDAVCIATPVPLHARQAIAALSAGKHVLSEVTAAYTLEECWDLVAAVERTGLTYMMAENYCFMDQVMQVQYMVEQGVFGDITYASGSYIHDCRELCFTAEGDLTWRGRLRHEYLANSYPTHSIGPVARWLGINRTDNLKTTATWNSPSLAAQYYTTRNQPNRAEYRDPGFWKNADTVTTCIRTERGALVDIRVDWASSRPDHGARYELQGTKASFSCPDGLAGSGALIWIEGRSPMNERGIAKSWEPFAKYRDEFEHPFWREHRVQAEKAGHGGGDYFVLREFAAAIREERAPLIDVYDAVTWSSLTPLSGQSIAEGNVPVAVPNFKKGKK